MLFLVLAILTVAFLLLCFTIVGATENHNLQALFTTLGIMVSCGITLYLIEYCYKQGQIDAMNGEYRYKQEIKYDHVDTGFVPVDTVYIKK